MSKSAKGAVVVAAALCGSLITIAVRGTPSPAAPNPPSTATAAVRQTNLATTVLTQGTLGFTPSPPVVNGIAGTYTGLLAAGTVVRPGDVLFRVDNEPVVLMNGSVPAWRPFAPGMTDGPDVQQLEANLIMLGDTRGLFAVAGEHYGAAAVAAVERWQISLGDHANGSIDLGAIVFLPAAVRLGAATVALGQQASPGAMPYQVTTTTRSVSVPLTPNDPTVPVGEEVAIRLPSGTSTSGEVTAVGPPPPSAASSSPSSSSGSPPSSVLTVTPANPAATGNADGEPVEVALTIQSVRHALAVPIAALVALAGGGYGLEVVAPSGPHHLIRVQTGVFAGGNVQVLGSGLRPGTRVVVAE